jgi:periplasmic copper chaperone A
MKLHFTAIALALCSASSLAHVVLEQPTAAAGSYYKATLRIGHGCAGSATALVRVFVPLGMQGARPYPKAGWTLEAPKAPLAQPYDNHGKRVTEDVREITWRGGPLPDAWADEFSFVGKLPTQPGPLAFKVLQECETGKNEWFDIAEPGASKAPAKPAAMLNVTPAAAPAHHH